ncbi:hypothetical protein ACSFCT_26520, partial [Yokenella regensburgei]|uniref:hypothetical protein n=1 Tax=Yokenella regensburgei TaxID=158877 RepID=UPI003EDAC1C7
VVTRYRARGAVRDVGKALGLSEDMTAGLAGAVWSWSREGVEEKHAEELNMDLSDRRLALTLELARQPRVSLRRGFGVCQAATSSGSPSFWKP